MRRYAKLSALDHTTFSEILNFFFAKCDKVNIYFPNTTTNEELTDFKNKFLAATHIVEDAEELSALEETLEEKEGFSMVIASLTEEIQPLLLNMSTNLHLDLGLIQGDKVLFYIGDEDECVIECDDDADLFKDSSLFDAFKTI